MLCYVADYLAAAVPRAMVGHGASSKPEPPALTNLKVRGGGLEQAPKTVYDSRETFVRSAHVKSTLIALLQEPSSIDGGCRVVYVR